ncbi:hypothetical protein LRR18_16560, partial [Mangrovimonas sp. AS39]|uniref:hypothetical protein n=1 Tax=Mangrovimonas futianensis TaxID=2895523 RepID=UPI001E371C28
NIKPVDFDTFVDFPGIYKGDFSFEKEAALQRAVTLKEGNFTKYKKNDFISNGYYLAKVAGWLPAQETELLPDMSLRHHWYQNINYRAILYKTPNLHEKYVDTYKERPLYIYVYHYVDVKNTHSHLTTSLSEPMCHAIHIPKWFTYSQKKTVNSLLGKTKKEKQAWLKDYFISSAKATNSILRLDFDDSKDW